MVVLTTLVLSAALVQVPFIPGTRDILHGSNQSFPSTGGGLGADLWSPSP